MIETTGRGAQAELVAAARLREIDASFRRRLSIAVLGPKISSIGGKYGRKRRQIYQVLRDDGHDAFYPEQRFNLDSHWAKSEAEVLSSPEVDLVIALQSPDSVGVFGELVAYSLIPAIKDKTLVLTPKKYYCPDESFLANAVSYYTDRVVYTERQFRDCCLLEDCKAFVNDTLFGESKLAPVSDF